jgi:hypothetical protein
MTTTEDNDERAPLLATVSPAPIAEPVPDAPLVTEEEREETGVLADDDTPLPMLQIVLLCYTRVVEPMAFFSIFPYINAMIERTGGVNKEDVGFYSGLIESLFSLTQMCVMLFWGKVCCCSPLCRIWPLTIAGLRSSWKEARPCLLTIWHHRGDCTVWFESIAVANDLVPMRRWSVCWYCRVIPPSRNAHCGS